MIPSTHVAIVGAGPYGLSIAAHLRARRVPFRVFGRPMDSWQHHMPDGMRLKSEGFASNLYAPSPESTLKQFCRREGLPYADRGMPVAVSTLISYGMHFQKAFVSELEPRCVRWIGRHPSGGFLLHLDDDERLTAKRVVLAVGITHFHYLPPVLASLPPTHVSHSYEHRDVGRFRNRHVTIVGGGASALDLAALLHEAGADVQLVVRQPRLNWCIPPEVDRPWWKRVQHPEGRLGIGWKLRLLETPGFFAHLPAATRHRIVRTWLGPTGGWSTREMVEGRLAVLLGCDLESAGMDQGRATLRVANGEKSIELRTDHVIAATGYRVDMRRLRMLDDDLRQQIRTMDGRPVLSRAFGSSVDGLHFVGLASATAFGPAMRFLAGAEYTARTLSREFARL
jgi:Pyridine nucleotide-disulphide oxidoreductase